MKDHFEDTFKKYRSAYKIRSGKIPINSEDEIKFESMSDPYKRQHFWSERTSISTRSLKKFLYSRVGQRWDDVYSEIKSTLKNDLIHNIEEKLKRYVFFPEDYFEEDGALFYSTSRRNWYVSELWNNSLLIKDGILCKYMHPKKHIPQKKDFIRYEIDGLSFKYDFSKRQWFTCAKGDKRNFRYNFSSKARPDYEKTWSFWRKQEWIEVPRTTSKKDIKRYGLDQIAKAEEDAFEHQMSEYLRKKDMHTLIGLSC